MKSIYFLAIALVGAMLLFSGCPIGIDYPLDEPGSKSIDKALLGTWTSDKEDATIKKVSIVKKDKTSYTIEVLEVGEYYTMETRMYTAWVTQIDKEKFLYAKPDNEDKYYIYRYKVTGKGSFETYDVGLLVGGIDGVTSTAAFREEVSKSMKMDDCFSDLQIWKKL